MKLRASLSNLMEVPVRILRLYLLLNSHIENLDIVKKFLEESDLTIDDLREWKLLEDLFECTSSIIQLIDAHFGFTQDEIEDYLYTRCLNEYFANRVSEAWVKDRLKIIFRLSPETVQLLDQRFHFTLDEVSKWLLHNPQHFDTFADRISEEWIKENVEDIYKFSGIHVWAANHYPDLIESRHRIFEKIKKFLQKNGDACGRENKIQVVVELFNYLGQRHIQIWLKHQYKLSKQVKSKFDEFVRDEPDMAENAEFVKHTEWVKKL